MFCFLCIKRRILHTEYTTVNTSVLSDFQTQRSNISNTRRSVSSDICKHQEVIYQTREGVFHLISKTREGVFHLIFKHLEVIYQTREGVFHLISKHLVVIYQTRERVFHCYPNTEKQYIKHQKKCFIR